MSKTKKDNTRSEAIDIPNEWPGTMGAFRLVRPPVKTIIWTLVSIFIAGTALTLIIDSVLKKDIALADVVGFVINSLVATILISLYVKLIKGEDTDLQNTFHESMDKFLNMLVAVFIVYVLLTISFILLIVPFFFVLPRLILAPIYVIHGDMSIGDALSTSWRVSKGNVGRIYSLIGLAVALGLLSITIVGIPLAIYWSMINYCSVVLLAMYLLKDRPAAKLA